MKFKLKNQTEEEDVVEIDVKIRNDDELIMYFNNIDKMTISKEALIKLAGAVITVPSYPVISYNDVRGYYIY